MRTIGVLGGLSSVASGEYYRLLTEGVNARLGGHSAAEIVMYSVDFAVMERFLRDQAWHEAGEYLADRAAALHPGVLGTAPVMESDFYRDRLARRGIAVLPVDLALADRRQGMARRLWL